jgi:hypothetical protein
MLRKKSPSSEAIRNMLTFFDIIGILTSNKLTEDNIIMLSGKCIDSLARRTGLVPPTECTITTHELLHLIDQSLAIGAPRFSNLFKFEKVNKFLKSMLKNVARGLPSILKNYMQKESIFFETALQVDEINSIYNLQKYLPRDDRSMKNLNQYLNKIYVETVEDNPDHCQSQIYDLESSNIVHFYGEKLYEKLNTLLFSYLLHNALEYPDITAPEDSLLKRLYDEWNGATGSKKPEAFYNFLKKSFNRNLTLSPHCVYMRYSNMIRQMKDADLKVNFVADFDFLVECFTASETTQVFPENYLFST